MYADSVVKTMKQDLLNECDYIREAENGRRFKDLVHGSGYYVPEVHLATENVIVTEFVEGVSIEHLANNAPQKVRDSVAYKILRLVQLEIFEFGFMQTDPNPANFYYKPDTDELILLDFGACSDYASTFTEKYREVVCAGVDKDYDRIVEHSIDIGFLTGKENKAMMDAHVYSIYEIGEPLGCKIGYDFSKTDMIHKVNKHAPTLLEHR